MKRKQTKHIINERALMSELDHPFVTKLCYSFTPCVYRNRSELSEQGVPAKFLQVIVEGTAVVSRRNFDGGEVKIVTLVGSDMCGERSLLTGEPATADIVAMGTVTTLNIEQHGMELMSQAVLDRLHSRRYAAMFDENEFRLDELQLVATLGAGAFGVVGCVVHAPSGKKYALKMINRDQVMKRKQTKHIINERALMSELDHPFVTKLHATFKSSLSLYMLLELSLGGELFNYLKSCEKHRMPEDHARFYCGGVVLAIEYLHSHNIVYRDLKPENVVLSSNGYIKMIDFGFAKKIAYHTYTLCGTPEYLAPEMILLSGHGFGVDWWAIGVFLYELVCGRTPFSLQTKNPTEVYQNIVNPRYEIVFPEHIGSPTISLVARCYARSRCSGSAARAAAPPTSGSTPSSSRWTGTSCLPRRCSRPFCRPLPRMTPSTSTASR